MKKEEGFFREAVIKIALPITLQSLFQASFSVVDQIMTGQLGEAAVAGIGLGGKFSSLFSVIVAAISTGAGILISQFVGSELQKKEKEKGVAGSFWQNLLLGLLLAVLFTLAGFLLPEKVMSLYSGDSKTVGEAASYLRILSVGFLPSAASMLLSTLLRCMGHAKLPLYASVASAAFNTVLNYGLIFGKWCFPEYGTKGAAMATTIARLVEFVLLLFFAGRMVWKREMGLPFVLRMDTAFRKLSASILLPLLACEFLWSLGENVYAVIYGRIGTEACAAMTLTGPVQSLMIGALTGIAQATGIVVGKKLGKGETEGAIDASRRFIRYGVIGSAVLSVILILFCGQYVKLYQVGPNVQEITRNILLAYALIAPVKVENMILGGGILRSGGKTRYVMMIDAIGTWGIGVPLGILSAYCFGLPVYLVYFILSLEEVVRLLISIWLFKKRSWMENLTVN